MYLLEFILLATLFIILGVVICDVGTNKTPVGLPVRNTVDDVIDEAILLNTPVAHAHRRPNRYERLIKR
jgi:hypothetical protein